MKNSDDIQKITVKRPSNDLPEGYDPEEQVTFACCFFSRKRVKEKKETKKEVKTEISIKVELK